MTESKICTCPSGDGSLRWPCPAHPAEQAGGDERASKPGLFCRDCGSRLMVRGVCSIYCPKCVYEGLDDRAKRSTSPENVEAVLVAVSRAALAQSSPVPVSNIEFARKLFEEMALIADDEKCIRMLAGALTQSSPTTDSRPAEWSSYDPTWVVDFIRDNSIFNADLIERMLEYATRPAGDVPQAEQAEADRPEVAEVAFVLRNIGAMDAEDIDGDNVDLRFEDAEGRDTGCDASIVEYAEKAADLLEQQDRIVGELRADRDSWAEQAEQRLADWDEMRKERDAALARVEQQERTIAGMNEAHAKLAGLYEAAQAQHSVPDDVETFLDEVRAELLRARSKFPGDRIMTIALAEEFGELCKAVLDEPAANVRKEAVQTAVMAARVVLDGDGSVTAWRAERGLDPLASAPGKEGL
ncbi:TPA: hypothetical protein L4H45_003109 [Pseudomonas aeruginosa]|nr:hypothetical protein [Pseudomonas aeruginosa]HBO2465098.1 hypothetical protein [Pseudomonas aeruginosa]